MITTKHVNNALVYYDDRYANRWLDAIGSNVVKWALPVGPALDDTTADPTGMIVTLTGTSVTIASLTPGDRLMITSDTSEYDGVNAQAHGSAFQIAAGKPCYFGARIAVQNGAKGDYLVGLCEVDNALLATASAHGLAVADDGLYFYQLNAGTSMIFVNELGGVEGKIASGVVTGNGAYHDYEFFYDGAVLYVYVDGVQIGSIASGLADQALTPSINIRAGDDGAEILYIQWMKAIQIR